jgi:hypothetical protein
MFNAPGWRMAVIAGCLAVVGASCQPKTSPSKPAEENQKPDAVAHDVETEREPASQPAAKPRAGVPMHKPKAPQQPMPAAIPKVALSGELRATCLVDVGQTMPAGELRDISGKTHTLASLYGQRLTVVCLWTIGTTYRSQLVAAATLQHVIREVAEPFAEKGVQVVGIDVGDPADAVGQEVAKAGKGVPILLDPNGEYFARIAKDKRMPRIFLLDAGGRVLWFDVECSRASRAELIQSIRVVLGEL